MRTGTAVTAVSRAPHICPFVMQECKQADVQLTVIRCGLFLPSRPLSIFALVSLIQKNSPPIFATSFGKTSVRLCFETQKHRTTFFLFCLRASCFAKNKLQGCCCCCSAIHKERRTQEKGLERPTRETIEQTDYSEEDNSADEQASSAGLHKRLPQLKGTASKQGVIANARNQQ